MLGRCFESLLGTELWNFVFFLRACWHDTFCTNFESNAGPLGFRNKVFTGIVFPGFWVWFPSGLELWDQLFLNLLLWRQAWKITDFHANPRSNIRGGMMVIFWFLGPVNSLKQMGEQQLQERWLLKGRWHYRGAPTRGPADYVLNGGRYCDNRLSNVHWLIFNVHHY